MNKKITIQELYENMQSHRPSDIEIYEEMKKMADENQKLYHCTTIEAFLSIVKNMEFWAFPLSVMNDEDEQYRLVKNEYDDKVFIISFSYKIFGNEDEWAEYSKDKKDNALIFSVKQGWFSEEMYCVEDESKILINNTETNLARKRDLVVNDFIGVYYDDIYEAEPKFSNEMFIFNKPRLAGFIKKKSGVSSVSKCKKSWSEEFEIRKRIVINKYFGIDFKPEKIIVTLNSGAFTEFDIKFSPFCSENFITYTKHEIDKILPNSKISYL